MVLLVRLAPLDSLVHPAVNRPEELVLVPGRPGQPIGRPVELCVILAHLPICKFVQIPRGFYRTAGIGL